MLFIFHTMDRKDRHLEIKKKIATDRQHVMIILPFEHYYYYCQAVIIHIQPESHLYADQ